MEYKGKQLLIAPANKKSAETFRAFLNLKGLSYEKERFIAL
jgi:hypothetical protein